MRIISLSLRNIFMTASIKTIANGMANFFITISSISFMVILFYGYIAWFIGTMFIVIAIMSIVHATSTVLLLLIIVVMVFISGLCYRRRMSTFNKIIQSKLFAFHPSCRTAFHLKHFYLSTMQVQAPLTNEYWEVHLKHVLPPKPELKNIKTHKGQIEEDMRRLKAALPSDAIIFGYSPRNLMPLIKGTAAEDALVVYSKAAIPPERAKLYRKYSRQWDYVVFHIKSEAERA